ncbi:MAG: hypothetical protein E6Q84_03320 [Thiothrix sp.]|nr:MAG: hypothetical protein E6Q84_03320 [Thiothrix sp.]
MDWLYKWGYSSSAILQQLLKKQATGYAAAATKAGYLIQTKSESGSPKYIYTLSEAGLQLATKHSPQLFRYPEIEPYKINQHLIRHQLLAQKATLNALQAGKISDYKTERMIDSEGDKLGEKKPDVVFIKDQLKIGVEIELSAKWDRKLDQFTMGIGTALANKAYQMFMIYSDSPAILDRYQKALNQPIKHWVKDDRGHWHAQGDRLFPESKRSLVQFQLIKEE